MEALVGEHVWRHLIHQAQSGQHKGVDSRGADGQCSPQWTGRSGLVLIGRVLRFAVRVTVPQHCGDEEDELHTVCARRSVEEELMAPDVAPDGEGSAGPPEHREEGGRTITKLREQGRDGGRRKEEEVLRKRRPRSRPRCLAAA